ncbi:S-ribosylhomocysteine lyase [Castellaniella sp. MT123]|uniref:S-ribosylhomocysteine lyase n=1 Tax=Castellaniella sp. MT123 TaxID=3140381 RepID=UPI0031F3594C
MIDVTALGWDPDTVGELDHRLLKAPSVKLRGAHAGTAGDVVYCIDLRLRLPNADAYLSDTEAHSIEHFLLEGFQRRLPEHFIGVGVMGCQTGFYLTLLNEGRRRVIEDVLWRVFDDMLTATAVPYARIDQCGRWRNHDLALAQSVAREVLDCRAQWGEIA